jgi:hypothetical protein
VSFCGGEIWESAEDLIWTPTALVWSAALITTTMKDATKYISEDTASDHINEAKFMGLDCNPLMFPALKNWN